MKQPPAIDGFNILRPLGEGGMGEVWLAKDLALNREVALKIIKPKTSHEETHEQRFRRESRLLAAIDHPSIVPVYRSGTDEGSGLAFFTMKAELLSPDEIRCLCDGVFGCAYPRFLFETADSGEKRSLSLRDLLEGHKTLPETTVARMGAQLAEALDALHAHKPPIVHRDIKPSNILFDASGRALLSDFGLAKTLRGETDTEDSGEPTLTIDTREGVHFVGSPSYAAPEQSDPNLPETPAMDFYSLGVILYEALTGLRPTTLDEPSSFDPKRISKAWDPLLRQLLSRDPSQRLLPRGLLVKRLRAIESGHKVPYQAILLGGAVITLGVAAYIFRSHPGTNNPQPSPTPASISETAFMVPDATPSPQTEVPSNPPRTINALIAQTETLRGNTNGLSGTKPRTINEFIAQMGAGQKAAGHPPTNETTSATDPSSAAILPLNRARP